MRTSPPRRLAPARTRSSAARSKGWGPCRGSSPRATGSAGALAAARDDERGGDQNAARGTESVQKPW